MDQEHFRISFVREYLRYCQKDRSTITGVFDYDSFPVVWGAIMEYGPPPVGGLVIDLMWDKDTASFRFWYGNENEAGRVRKGRVVMHDELRTEAASSPN